MPVLQEIVGAVPGAQLQGDGGVQVRGVAFDNRMVQPGDLFVAMRGESFDGLNFVPDAVARGAVAVLAQAAPPKLAVPLVLVPNARRALPLAAAAVYGYPARKLGMVGVTGTDGKTTTSHLTAALLEGGGHRAGLITTVDVKIGDRRLANQSHHTTPEAAVVQRWLAEIVDAGADYAVVEASSHALAQGRVEACEFDVGIFTNLTPEHLNFHGSLAAYRWDKARLFSMLGESVDKGRRKLGVINADDRSARFFQLACPVPVVTYGIEQPAAVTAKAIEVRPDGLSFVVVAPQGQAEIRSQLVGRFNVYNWLAAISAALSQGVTLEQIAATAPQVPPVAGRLQWVRQGPPFGVIVDFAHTPDALATVLRAARQFTSGRVLAVFGHAGGRDLGNRPRMGEAGAHGADFFVITTDDPCDEDPAAISAEVARGARAAGAEEGKQFVCIEDRREAFREAFRRARPGDLVLLTGRGHEQFLPIGQQKIPFDDVQVAREVLAEG